MAENIIVFQDFVVDKLIKEEAFSNNVTRVEAKSSHHDLFVQLDVNTEKNPMSFGERFRMALAWTPNSDVKKDTKLGCEDKSMITQEKIKEFLAESYDYIMCGELYKISEEKERNSDDSARISREIYASFDGLLMMLKGNRSYLPQLMLDDQTLYLLIKKLGLGASLTLREYIKP